MLRANALVWLAVMLSVLCAGRTHAFPFVTTTLFGDEPAVQYFPPPFREEINADKAVAAAAGSARDRITAPKVTAENSDSGRAAQLSPAPPSALLGGYQSSTSTGATEAPLASLYAMNELNDTRLIEEADEHAALARLTATEEEMMRPVSGDEIGDAVLEGARAARDRDDDASVQREFDSELEQELRLIKFEFVEVGVMGELVNEDGVLGLVEVTEVFDDDEQIVDDEGQVVNVKKNDTENEIVKWKSDARFISQVASGPLGDVVVVTEAESQAVERLGLLDVAGQTTTRSDQLSRAVVASAYAGSYLRNVDYFSGQQEAKAERREERQFSLQRLIIFLRLIFGSVETYLGMAAMLAVALFVKQVARAG